MSTEESRKIVLGFLENMNSNPPAAFATLADSATWWLPGNFALSGTHSKAEFAKIGAQLAPKLETPIKLTVKGVTAEGDRVAVEAESYAKMKSGKIYNNLYHFLFVVRDGKIQSVKEYLDTTHAAEVLCA